MDPESICIKLRGDRSPASGGAPRRAATHHTAEAPAAFTTGASSRRANRAGSRRYGRDRENTYSTFYSILEEIVNNEGVLNPQPPDGGPRVTGRQRGLLPPFGEPRRGCGGRVRHGGSRKAAGGARPFPVEHPLCNPRQRWDNHGPDV